MAQHHQALCDDILINIFHRLPLESVSVSKSVSKRWNCLLYAPSFRSKYMRSMNLLMGDSENDSTPLSLLGLFQGSTWPEEISDQTAPRLSYMPSTEPFMPLKSCKFMDDPDCFFVGSSNSGIILYGRHPSMYFVCSPLADQWVRLPPPNDKTCGAMNVPVGFSFEEIQDTVSDTVRGRYRVVRANLRSISEIAHDTLLIETYYSETGVWEESVLRGCIPFLIIPRWPSTVLRGIFYWVPYQSTIVACNPDASHYRVWLIELPPSTDVQNVVLGESSSDGLLRCGIDDNVGSSLGLKVLEKIR